MNTYQTDLTERVEQVLNIPNLGAEQARETRPIAVSLLEQTPFLEQHSEKKTSTPGTLASYFYRASSSLYNALYALGQLKL